MADKISLRSWDFWPTPLLWFEKDVQFHAAIAHFCRRFGPPSMSEIADYSNDPRLQCWPPSPPLLPDLPSPPYLPKGAKGPGNDARPLCRPRDKPQTSFPTDLEERGRVWLVRWPSKWGQKWRAGPDLTDNTFRVQIVLAESGSALRCLTGVSSGRSNC